MRCAHAAESTERDRHRAPSPIPPRLAIPSHATDVVVQYPEASFLLVSQTWRYVAGSDHGQQLLRTAEFCVILEATPPSTEIPLSLARLCRCADAAHSPHLPCVSQQGHLTSGKHAPQGTAWHRVTRAEGCGVPSHGPGCGVPSHSHERTSRLCQAQQSSDGILNFGIVVSRLGL